jgi:acetolactate synthase-1/3 small subunit
MHDSTHTLPSHAGIEACSDATRSDHERASNSTVLELRVRNHPGTMSHVTGLFARRAFNLEAIACAPTSDGAISTMLLLVPHEPRLEQVERQLEKLHDVLSVRQRPDVDPGFFARFVSAAGR